MPEKLRGLVGQPNKPVWEEGAVREGSKREGERVCVCGVSRGTCDDN